MDGVETKHSGAEALDAALLQTSALRVSAEALATDPCEEHALADIVRAGRALNGALRRPGFAVLLDGGDVLEKMALLGRTLSADDAEAAADVFRSLTNAIGILEQSLDAVLVGAAAEQLEGYGDAMLEAFPARWRPYFEPDEEADAPRNEESGDSPPVDAAAAEPSLETTFLVEVLDRLATCEEAALEWEDADAVRGELDTIESCLETIEGAFTAVGLDARTLTEARRLLSVVRDAAQPFEPHSLAEVLLEIAAWARCQAARACDLGAFASDLVPDLRSERLRGAPKRASEEDSTLDVERLLRRLRRPLRAAAAACGCWADVDCASPALRLDRLVAGRVTRALSVLLRSAFEGRAGGALRPGVLRILRVRVESWEPTSLVVVVDETAGAVSHEGDSPADAGHDGNGDGRPEALHGIDVTRDPTPEDWERLAYRSGFSNVVVMVVPEGSLRAAESSS